MAKREPASATASLRSSPLAIRLSHDTADDLLALVVLAGAAGADRTGTLDPASQGPRAAEIADIAIAAVPLEDHALLDARALTLAGRQGRRAADVELHLGGRGGAPQTTEAQSRGGKGGNSSHEASQQVCAPGMVPPRA